MLPQSALSKSTVRIERKKKKRVNRFEKLAICPKIKHTESGLRKTQSGPLTRSQFLLDIRKSALTTLKNLVRPCTLQDKTNFN